MARPRKVIETVNEPELTPQSYRDRIAAMQETMAVTTAFNAQLSQQLIDGKEQYDERAREIVKLHRQCEEHRKMLEAAQEGRTSLLQDIARLSGMLDMLREMGCLPTQPPAEDFNGGYGVPPFNYARNR